MKLHCVLLIVAIRSRRNAGMLCTSLTASNLGGIANYDLGIWRSELLVQ
jgi:membrane protein YqaA with SNARE-associated domain